MHTPVAIMWQEDNTVIAIFMWCFGAFCGIVVLKIFLSRTLMSVIISMHEQDVIDSAADGLDKDIVDRLSNIEKYTILRNNSSVFSVASKNSYF